ncbi:hypothetical protein AALA69_05615 [Eggerthellaceae bacterium 24-137]
MAENTHPEPSTSTGYGAQGRALEHEAVEGGAYPVADSQPLPDGEAAGFALEAVALSGGEPARVNGTVEAASAGSADEMLGEVLQSQELNPSEPAVTNDPVPLEGTAPTATGYGAEGRILEQQAVAQAYPGQPVASNPVSAAQAAYQAAYGAPACAATAPQAAVPVTPGAPVAPPRATAPKKAHAELDPERVFLICGMVVGCVIVVFGLCMLAFYTPAEVSEFFDGYRMNGSAGWSDTGATAQQILKAGFSMLLIGLGATDICAFGAKLMKARKQRK